ncbi:MAG: hypothetical protein ABSC92_14185 [Rhizomicrobium sp.]|jgi:hypothetical protein
MDMTTLNLFVPLTKVDVEKRLVYGTVAEEIADRSGEIMDYETAKPEFAKWSADIAKASDGKSVGNLRSMHGSVAAGKLESIAFDDAAKRIEACGKVIDDGEWNKVLEGVYTGFSMGGKYLRRWRDAEAPHLTRYTPQPAEVSLVDNPCIPTATFEVVKADGSMELRKFKTPTNVAPDVEQGWRAKDGSFHATKAAALKHNAEAGTIAKIEIAAESDLSKIGARNSAADLARIQQLHDTACELGAKCATGEDESDTLASGAFLRVSAENAMLRKAMNDIAPRIETALAKIAEQNARIEALESQPAAGGPVVAGTRLVTKGQELGADPGKAFQEHLAKLSPDERTLVLMKMSLAQPLATAPDPLGTRA